MTAYHVILRHRGDQSQLWEQHELDGHPMSYPDARAVLLAAQATMPNLHLPRAKYYLVAEPMREVAP